MVMILSKYGDCDGSIPHCRQFLANPANLSAFVMITKSSRVQDRYGFIGN